MNPTSLYRILLSLILTQPFLADAQILQWTYDDIVMDVRQSGANPDLHQADNGDIYLSFWNSNLNSLSFAKRGALDGNWTLTESFLPSGPHGFASAITTDANGAVHIAYMNRIEGNIATLRYATNQSGSWVVESPLGNENLGPYGTDLNAPRLAQASIDIELQPDGEPIISVYDGSVDTYAGCSFTNQASYLQYDLELKIVSRDGSGTWSEASIPEIPNVNYPGCLPQGDRFGEFCQMARRSDGTIFVITNSFHNHQILLFRSDSTDYQNWEVQVLDSLGPEFSGNLRYFDTYEQPFMVMSGDSSISVLVSGSEQYGFSNSVNRHILSYYRFQQDTSDADLYVEAEVEVFPTLLNYRSNLTMSIRHPDTIYQAFIGIRDNFLQVQHSFDGGGSWEVDSVDQFVTAAPLVSAIVGDSFLVIGFDQFRNAIKEYSFPADLSSMTSRYVTVQENRGQFIRSVVERSSGNDEIALLYPESFSQNLIIAQNPGGNWQEEIIGQSTSPVSGTLIRRHNGELLAVISEENPDQVLEIQETNGIWDSSIIVQEILDGLQSSQDQDSLYLGGITRLNGEVVFLSRGLTDSTWARSRIDTMNAPFQSMSNIILRNNIFYVAYSNQGTGQMWMATRAQGGSWTAEVVTQPQSYTPVEIELQINSSGLAVIAFKDAKSDEVILVEKGATEWTISEVPTDPGNLIGSPLELVLDSKDRPWILYNFPDIQDEIRLLRRNGSGVWFGVSVLNNTSEIANEFQLHLVEDDFYVFGRKNDPANRGIASLYAAEGVRTLIGKPIDLLELAISPNPTDGTIRTNLHVPEGGEVLLHVYNLQGKTVHFQEEFFAAGLQSFESDLSHLPAGSYLLSVESGGMIGYQKLMLIR